jgi:hypothetical protein
VKVRLLTVVLTVGRPGLDPGTLGLKEGYIWSDSSGGVGIIRESKNFCPVVSDSSGGVGMVCGMKCGISERTVQLRIALAHVRSRNETLRRLATSCAFANLECDSPRVCSPRFPKRFRFKSCTAHHVVTLTTMLLDEDHGASTYGRQKVRFGLRHYIGLRNNSLHRSLSPTTLSPFCDCEEMYFLVIGTWA